jgi:hypothetical protein
MAPWRGTKEVLEADDFFLILGAAIQSHKMSASAAHPAADAYSNSIAIS